MREFLIIIVIVNLFCAPTDAAGDILMLQSVAIKPYNDALQGLRSVCKAKGDKIVTADLSEAEIAGMVWKRHPELILAIGEDALAKVRRIRDVPVVYMMVLHPRLLVQERDNVTGVSIQIAPEKQFAQMRQILPHFKRIGLLFDPAKSGAFVEKANDAASLMGIELLSKSVHSSREAVAAIDGFKGKVDAIWLFPDTTVVNPATIDLLFLCTLTNGIPVLTFSEKYAEKGALMSMEVDAREVGRQAGEMANKLLAGNNVRNIEREDARGGNLTVNLIVAKKLGITINGNAVKHARVIK